MTCDNVMIAQHKGTFNECCGSRSNIHAMRKKQ